MSDTHCGNSRSGAANLGCGTLILIALIVLFLGNLDEPDLGPLESQVASLRDEVDQLQRQQRATHALLETIVLHIDTKPAGDNPGDAGAAPPVETVEP